MILIWCQSNQISTIYWDMFAFVGKLKTTVCNTNYFLKNVAALSTPVLIFTKCQLCQRGRSSWCILNYGCGIITSTDGSQPNTLDSMWVRGWNWQNTTDTSSFSDITLSLIVFPATMTSPVDKYLSQYLVLKCILRFTSSSWYKILTWLIHVNYTTGSFVLHGVYGSLMAHLISFKSWSQI